MHKMDFKVSDVPGNKVDWITKGTHKMDLTVSVMSKRKYDLISVEDRHSMHSILHF